MTGLRFVVVVTIEIPKNKILGSRYLQDILPMIVISLMRIKTMSCFLKWISPRYPIIGRRKFALLNVNSYMTDAVQPCAVISLKAIPIE